MHDAPVPSREAPLVLDGTSRPADLNLRYADHADGLADVWLPADSAPAPIVMVVHGGYWRQRTDRSHAVAQCAALADRGFVVVLPEYRRVGGAGGWPGTFDDIGWALEQLPTAIAAAAPNRVDHAPPVLVGHSAGGHLALWAVGHRRSPVIAAGVVALAPVAALADALEADLGAGAVKDLLSGLGADDIGLLDPLALIPAGVPTVLIHGTLDDEVPISQSRTYAAAAEEAGDPCRLIEVPDLGHYEFLDPAHPVFDLVVESISSLGTTPVRRAH